MPVFLHTLPRNNSSRNCIYLDFRSLFLVRRECSEALAEWKAGLRGKPFPLCMKIGMCFYFDLDHQTIPYLSAS